MNKTKIKTNIIIASTTTLIISGVVLGCLWFSKTMAFKNLINSFRSSTSGIERKVEVYTYNGEKIQELEGKIYVEDGNGGTISVTTEKEKYIYSNVSVVIKEEK